MKQFAIFLRRRLGNRFAGFGTALIPVIAMHFETRVSAEVVFQDFFAPPATNITNSIPWIDVGGNGWQTGASASQLALDGSGHVYNSAASAGTAVGVPLIPIGPHGSMTASAMMELPVGSTEWTGIGFADSNLFLPANGSGSGPWLQVQGNGNLTLYGGAGLNNAATVANAFTNTHMIQMKSPLALFALAVMTSARAGVAASARLYPRKLADCPPQGSTG